MTTSEIGEYIYNLFKDYDLQRRINSVIADANLAGEIAGSEEWVKREREEEFTGGFGKTNPYQIDKVRLIATKAREDALKASEVLDFIVKYFIKQVPDKG